MAIVRSLIPNRCGSIAAVLTLALAVGFGFAPSAQAEGDGNPAFKRKQPGTGYLVRGAFAVGLPRPGNSPPTQIGFLIAAGGRWLPVIGFDGEFAWGAGDLSSNAFTILGNTRVYPLSIFEATRDFPIEPYALTGMGGGHSEISGVSNGSYVINLGFGAEWMLGKHFGVYSELAHRFYVTDRPPFDGLTNFNFGAIYMF